MTDARHRGGRGGYPPIELCGRRTVRTLFAPLQQAEP